MVVLVCLDLDCFVEWSNGVFGKLGIGKFFLIRLLIFGIIYKQVVVNLMFDMYLEYGWEVMREGKIVFIVKGLW